jgi:hypothetical protein
MIFERIHDQVSFLFPMPDLVDNSGSIVDTTRRVSMIRLCFLQWLSLGVYICYHAG